MAWEPGKPSQNEDEWFARRDAEWLKEQRAKLDAERKAQSAQLTCPRCGATLAQRVWRGVTLDSCPSCHGLWSTPASRRCSPTSRSAKSC